MKRLLAVIPVALALTACGTKPGSDGRPSVVAGAYPMAFVAQQVGGPGVKVTNLTSPGAEPHDVELTGGQVAALADADVVIHIPGLQAAVDDAITSVKAARTINLLDHVTPLRALKQQRGEVRGPYDPHLWLDPDNLVPATNAVADALAAADPSHAAGYRHRAASLVGKLTRLDADYRAGLRTCQRRTIVTSHAAFGYLARAYRLTQIPIAGIEPSQEPSTSDLAGIARTVKAAGVTTVFTETLVSPAIADTVARETGAHTATLDPIEGLTKATARDDYFSLMRDNLAAIRTADSCS